MKLSENVASEDKIGCFFEKLANEKEKEAEKQRRASPSRVQSTPKRAKELVAGPEPFPFRELTTETGPGGG